MKKVAERAVRLVVFGALLLSGGLLSPVCAQEEQNRLLAVSLDAESGPATLLIRTERPVGYRYTVYDSSDPVRVVLDFPGMDVTGVASSQKLAVGPLLETRVSSFELTSGKLGRVELLLSKATPYDVELSGNEFRIAFARTALGVPETPVPVEADAEGDSAVPVDEEEIVEVEKDVVEVVTDSLPSAATVAEVEVGATRTVLKTDGRVEKFRHFPLTGPPRLVVDLYGVRPEFEARSFDVDGVFTGLRVGTYDDKTRFVFDATGETVPDHAVTRGDNSVLVLWGASGDVASEAAPEAEAPVSVLSVDFHVQDGESVLAVQLSASAEIVDAEKVDDVVRFGVKNATISRALRRSVDASSFPSALRLVTPYTVQAGETQDVLFAVELKGPVPYDLKIDGDRLLFVVSDGPFAEAAPVAVEQVEASVTAAEVVSAEVVPVTAEEAGSVHVEPVVKDSPEAGMKYAGEKITLVFDDADVRRIFQLIGEVSDLNVLVGDEVQGNITLRLIDVPWDQALDLILDIKNLGMLQEGNVVRILPRDTIRAMRQAELTAVKEERELEPLVTEVIGVSYTALANISVPAGELLTDRGKITADDRNKQLIVTDILSVIDEVKKLVDILDTPEKQVMIEARIVEASDDFTRDLGVSWNLSYVEDAVGDVNDLSTGDIGGGGTFNISPFSAAPGGLGSSFTFGKLGVSSTVLDLRISAAESVSQAKVLSKPRISTLNGETATISQGTQIPYQSTSDDGTKTEFVDATLELNVTPVINPDDSIILEVKTSKNSPVVVAGASAPGIDKNEANTKLLVQNGETTVIGGIFTEDASRSEAGIPLLRSLPIIGHLFKSNNRTETRSELLIFITPRILD